MRDLNKKTGFTLAEVLITLGIIGVVASITIPILQRNIQDAEFKSAFLKEYSTAQNAFRKAATDNGGSLVGYSKLSGFTSGRSNELKDFIKPYLSYIKECNNAQVADCSPVKTYKTYYNTALPPSWSSLSSADTYPHAVLIMKDGSIWRFFATYENMGNCTNDSITNTKNSCGTISIDTNGAKKPNQGGNDLFEFHIAADGTIVLMGTQNDYFLNGISKTIGYNPRVNYMLGVSK